MPISPNSNIACTFNKSILERIIFLLPLLITLVFICIFVYFPDTYLWLIHEDGIVEYAQALLFLCASIVGFLSIWRIRKSQYKQIFWILLIFAVGCLFIFLEEISWGQRLLNIKTPFFFLLHNTQYEINVHNMDVFKGKTGWPYIIIGICGIGWIFIRNSNLKAADLRSFIIPEWYCCLYLLPRGIFSAYNYMPLENKGIVIWPQIAWWRHQEPLEFLLALGFFLVALGNYQKVAKLIK